MESFKEVLDRLIDGGMRPEDSAAINLAHNREMAKLRDDMVAVRKVKGTPATTTT